MIITPILAAFLLYFCILTSIGFYFYKKTVSLSDFMVGDRSINYWVTAIATQASDMGSWLFLGLPADLYTKGLFGAWAAIGLVVGMYLTWHFVAPRLRILGETYGSTTLAGYFAHHYHDTHARLQVTSALFTILFTTFYIASGLVSLAIVFESVFGIPYQIGMLISVITASLYSLLGGFTAIAWCDLFQGIFLMCMIIIVPTAAWFSLPDALNTIITNAHISGKTLSLFPSYMHVCNALILAAGWGLGYFGQPHILMNFMGIDNPASITYAKRIGMAWQISVLTAAIAIGIIGIGFFQYPLANNQLIFVYMTHALFSPFWAGIILCAIIAATLSTIDSLILTAGNTFTQDIYLVWSSQQSTTRTLILVSRISSLAVAAAALLIASTNHASVYDLVNYAWAGLGSAFGPLIIVSLYTTTISAPAALAGLITGGLISAFWPYGMPLVPGFVGNFIALYATAYIGTLFKRP